MYIYDINSLGGRKIEKWEECFNEKERGLNKHKF
jgi:hypothetical protein